VYPYVVMPNDEEKIRQIVEDVVHQELKKSPPPQQNISSDEQKAAVDCTNAHNVALQTLHYCEQQGGALSGAEVLNVLQDCIEMTDMMNSAILRKSKLESDIVGLCAQACDGCVKLAENFGEDEQMKNLLQYCKIAGESVKKI